MATRKKSTPKTGGSAKAEVKGSAGRSAARKTSTSATTKKATGKKATTKTTTKAAKKTTSTAKKTTTSRKATQKTARAAAPSSASKGSSAASGQGRSPRKPRGRAAAPATLEVREEEDPWTAEELDAVRIELEEDVVRLTSELSGFETEILGLMGESGDGAGDDQADVGTKTFEREHEFSLAQNSRDMLIQSQHALERIADGTYGQCESCGNPIGKLRLQAFPRATLCMACKQKQERR